MFLKIVIKPIPLRHSLTTFPLPPPPPKKKISFHGGKFVCKTKLRLEPSYKNLILLNYNKDFDAHCK